MRRSLSQLLANLALIVMAAHLAAAQAPKLKTRTKEDREREFQASHRITINVQVTDKAGKPVTDLDAKDFTIFDNRQPRKLAAFHPIDGEALNDATEVIILLDAVNTPSKELDAEKRGIFKYLSQSHAALPYLTSFVLWSNGHLKAVAATRDRNAVGKAFVFMTKNIHTNACAPEDPSIVKTAAIGKSSAQQDDAGADSSAAKCLEIHLKDSLAALDGIAQEQHRLGGRTILVWMGAGWPARELAQLPPQARKSYANERVELLNDLQTSQVTLDALAADAPDQPPMKHEAAETASQSDTGPLELSVMARHTGGRVIANSDDITADLAKLLEDADWYYALGFNPPPASGGVELRSLEVKVNRPGVEVRTMTGYFTDPY